MSSQVDPAISICRLARQAGVSPSIVAMIETALAEGRPWSIDRSDAEQIASAASSTVESLFSGHQLTRRIGRELICQGCNNAIPPIEGSICAWCNKL